jgi:type IV pilus assembly protein PilO
VRREVWIAVGAATLLVLWGYWLLGYRPLYRQLQAQRQVLAAKEKEMDAAHQLMARYAEFRERAAKIQMDAQRLEARIPTELRVPALLKDITRAATECNLKEFQFSPQPVKTEPGLTVLPIRLTVVCSYHSLGRFITQLGTLPRLLVAEDLKLTGRDKTGKTESLTAVMTVLAYVRKHP